MSLIRAMVALLFALVLGSGAVLAQDASPSPAGASGPSPGAASPAAASPATGTEAEGQEVEVSGIEYAFVGVPENIPVGTSVRLRNDGQEVHEFSVARRNDPMDQTTVEELLAMEDEAFTLITLVGTIYAEPGQTSQDTLTLTEPGRYIAVCFIPQGTTELPEGLGEAPSMGSSPGPDTGTGVEASPAAGVDASPGADTGVDASPAIGVDASPGTGLGDGPPHVALGMFVEFTVGDEAGVDAGASPAADASPGAEASPGAGMDVGRDASPEPSPAG